MVSSGSRLRTEICTITQRLRWSAKRTAVVGPRGQSPNGPIPLWPCVLKYLCYILFTFSIHESGTRMGEAPDRPCVVIGHFCSTGPAVGDAKRQADQRPGPKKRTIPSTKDLRTRTKPGSPKGTKYYIPRNRLWLPKERLRK